MDQLGKSVDTIEKGALELVKWSLASKLRKCTDVCLVGGKLVSPTIQTSVKFRDFEELYTVFIRKSAHLE